MKRLFFRMVMIGMLLSNSACGQSETVDVEIDTSTVEATSVYHPGLTHTQRSIDSWGNSTAIGNAKLLLDSVSHFQNQHIMGWGAESPWPDSTIIDPEDWSWESLDARMDLIRETNGVAVITLCGAPTWMYAPSRNGETDWSALETAPTRSHYDEFAHLCAEVARRYPDVRYFQVWNEMKGFYYAAGNRWNYENYTILYNMVYDSLKAINPELKIGGPYVVMDSWSTGAGSNPSVVKGAYGNVDQRSLDVITYWLQHKKGAEFITIDGGNQNRDGVWSTDHFRATDKFADVIHWIQQQNGGEALPVWWAEWYAYPTTVEPHGDASHEDRRVLNAVMTSGLIKSIRAGYANLMIWQPQGDAQGYSFPLGIWTSTEQTGGGQATLFYQTQKILKDHFSAGVKLLKTQISQPGSVAVLAADSCILLVNQLNKELRVKIKGISEPVLLSPYEVRFLSDVEYSGDMISSIAQGEGMAFSIYPNPSSDNIYIQAGRYTADVLTLEVYAMNGGKVLTETMQRDKKERGLFAASLRDLGKGIYLIKIRSLQGTYTQLISKK